MTSHRVGGLSNPIKTGLNLCLLALAGFLVNRAPVEALPGIQFVFGGAFALLAAVRYGPLAGGLVGFVAALPTWPLWSQPLPLSAVLYGLEGAAVGGFARAGRRSVVGVDLAYWLLVGSWLNLAVQLVVIGLPFRLALIIQCRSVLNGLLVAMAVELGLLVHGITRRRSNVASEAPRRPSFQSVVTLGLTALISVPILGITVRNARSQSEQRIADLEASARREAEAIRGEVAALAQSYGRGLSTAAEIIERHGLMSPSFLQDVLGIVHRQYPEFAGLYVADGEARTLVHEPPVDDRGESLIGLDYSDREYYREILARKTRVYSGVYQARGGKTAPAVAIGAPVLSGDGGEELRAFVLGWFDVGRSFGSLVDRFTHEGASVVITDRDGKLIAHSRFDAGAYTRVRDLSQQPDFARQGPSASGAFVIDELGALDRSPALAATQADRLIAYAIEPMTGWHVWIHQSLGPIQQEMLYATTVHLLVLMVSLLVALVLSAGLARLLVSPLEPLRRSAERLAEGDLSERPVESFLATTEIDSLFRSFSAMAGNLDRAWDRQHQLLEEVTLTKRDLEATFEAMTDAVVITDAEDRIVRTNRAFRALGKVDVDVHGRRLSEVGHPDGDWESCGSCTARRSGASATILLAPEENITGQPVEARVDQIRDAEGRIVGAVQVIRDLTELRRWEAEAERAESLLRNFVEAAYDAVFVIDLQGRLQWANQRTLEVLGLGRRSVRGRSYLDRVHPEDREAAESALKRAAAGAAHRHELRLVAGGSQRHVLLTLSPIHVPQEVVSLLGIARDVTEEKLASERARRDDKLRALGQLAAGVAHNFNNALTAVLGYTQIARSHADDPEVLAPLDTVQVAAHDAARMVRRIQQFARSEKEEPLRDASVEEIVRDALELTRSRWETDAQASGIHYEVHVAAGAEGGAGTIECDPSALREVFVNLVINALDSMPEGGLLTIEITDGGDSVSVSVSDTGCGMTDDVRERIFDPFFTTKGPTGQGMGLAVSYGTIQRHHGQIHVTSEPGRGSRIAVVLPRRPQPRTAASGVPEEPVGEPEAEGPWRSVLVAEDEEPIRRLLVVLLSRARFEVTIAADGREALEHLAAASFDLILTDLAMPGADGMAVAREARRCQPEAKVIVMTGYGGIRREASDAWSDEVAIDAWLAKPFDVSTLIERVEHVLGTASRPRPDGFPSPGASDVSTGWSRRGPQRRSDGPGTGSRGSSAGRR